MHKSLHTLYAEQNKEEATEEPASGRMVGSRGAAGGDRSSSNVINTKEATKRTHTDTNEKVNKYI